MFKKLKSQIQEADGDPFSSPTSSTSSTIRRSSSNNIESPNEFAEKLDHNGNFINENFPTNKQTFKEFGEYENDDRDQISILEHKLSELDIEREQLKEQNEQSIEKNRTLMKKNDQLSHKIIELKTQLEQIEVEKDQMKMEYEDSQAKLKEELDKEKLINEEDLQNLKNKLAESVNDYRETINKCKQRKQKLKNKLNHSIAALSMIDRILFATEYDEVTALTQLIKNLSKKTESDEEEEETFDEGDLRQLVYEKQAEFESLKDEVEMNRAKLKEEKKKLIGEKQIQMDELQEKLTNLDLKYKQITLNGNQELQEVKKRISALEDELKKTKTEKEILSSQLKTEEKEKNKAVLELPSMKARLAEIETEHEKRLKDELKFKQDYYEAVMSEIEENHRREMEANRKRIDRLRAELNEPEKTRESRLRAECEKLRKQLDEMNYFYANLVEEKSQLISVLNELKEKKDRFRFSNKLDQTLNEFSKSSLDSANLKNQALEAAETHYLRKVVYSYMMGIDSKTMANVIATILKFSDDEKRRLFENEKTKSSWFS